MSKVRVAGFSLSIDGFGAGVDQSLQDPLGKRGRELFQWFFGTRTFHAMFGETGGSQGTDETYAARSMAGFGAFILTHHPRDPLVMEGGTTFHFVTDGIESALDQAKAAAGDKDVKIGGGVSTIRQYLQAGLIDEMHFAIAPVVLGQGEAMFAGVDLHAMGFKVTEHAATELATHVVLTR
jgi:dihydrofolate reductase